MARDTTELRTVFHEVKGLPWVNTLAADSRGEAWYTDASATPRLTPAAQRRFTTRLSENLVAALLYQNRIALLDGSDPGDDWQDHPDARSPGLEPPQALPEMATRQVVLNANDSHWCNAPGVVLEGYSVMGGLERTPRTLRTRQNLLLAKELVERGGATRDDLFAVVFDNASLSAALLCDEVVARIDELIARGVAALRPEGHEVPLRAVRDVLAGWDRAYRLDSVGAVLWREFMSGFEERAWLDAGPLWARPFDPEDPLLTPNGLGSAPDRSTDPGGDPVMHALAEAVRVLDAAGVPIDAPLGTVQWADRGDARVAVHGGGEGEGIVNVLAPRGALPPASMEPLPPAPRAVAGRERTGLREGGYPVTYGTSFLMVVELLPEGPRGEGLLAYGQNATPTSPHHHDGTDAYASCQVRPLRFTDEQIADSPGLQRLTLRG